MFHGSIAAIATPFKDGAVDEKSLRDLVEFQIAGGTHGLAPCGSTGESATLSYEEHQKVIEIVIDQTAGRVPVIAGAGSNSTEETVFLAEHARRSGADAVLLITPYYNKPTQKGLYEHFKTVSERVDIPQVLYNVPGRTGVNMLPETVVSLSKLPRIAAIKEASGSVDQAAQIIKDASDGFAVLSGEDSLTFPLLCLGAKGVISVAANVAPDSMAALCDLFEKGDIAGARNAHYKLHDLFKAMFYETNPIPVKKALYLMGMAEDEVRLPLVPLSPEYADRLGNVLNELGIKTVR